MSDDTKNIRESLLGSVRKAEFGVVSGEVLEVAQVYVFDSDVVV
jgi:hypothetical protein